MVSYFLSSNRHLPLCVRFHGRDVSYSGATYKRYFDKVDVLFKYKLEEQPIYGSDRIGQNTSKLVLKSASTFAALTTPMAGINTISEYQNWITTTNKKTLLPSSISDDLCNCKVKTMASNSPANTSYAIANTNAVEFLGVANNGIAVAENLQGQLQFYTVLAKKYLGNMDACLIFDKNGKLMKGTDAIALPDANSKPVIINIHGTNNYAVITLNAAQKPVYHIVDMGMVGYGPVGNSGEVIEHDKFLNLNTVANAKQGYHFTGVEDHINGNSIVYSTRYTPSLSAPTTGTTEILAYDFGASAISMPEESVLYTIPGCGSTETGELQISPNGDKLAWYQHDKSIAGFKHRQGYIYTLPLTPNRLGLAGAPDIKPISQAGNYGNGMLDFMKNNTNLLFAQRGLYNEGTALSKYDKNVWNYNPLTPSALTAINPSSTPLIGYLFGEIRRGVDGNLYIPNMGAPADKIHSYTGSTWNSNINSPTAVTDITYELASSLPTQVYKIYSDPNQLLTYYRRSVGNKQYELKDHLGNVKVVISDRKLFNTNISSEFFMSGEAMFPEVLTYTDYYPFGSPMPGRSFNSGDYKYGFNGQEKDDEIAGAGNINTAEFWQYDTRLGRRWNVDPLAHEFPWQSPYSAFDNDPINKIDPTGMAATPPDEFDKNGTKITDLGGDKVNFYHQEDGTTIVEDQQTCATNTIKLGKSGVNVI